MTVFIGIRSMQETERQRNLVFASETSVRAIQYSEHRRCIGSTNLDSPAARLRRAAALRLSQFAIADELNTAFSEKVEEFRRRQ